MSPGKHIKARRSVAAVASLSLVAGGIALLATPASAAVGGDLIYGLTAGTTGERLVTFRAETPGTIVSDRQITFANAGSDVLAIDVRPATGELYALVRTTTNNATSSGLFVIDPATGVATARGAAITPNLTGTRFGFDFNPVPDRVRIVTDTDQNLRVNPDTGGASANTPPTSSTGDGTLAYSTATSEPARGQNPDVAAAAYTNSVAGASATTLYDIDVTRGSLVRQAPPNDGTLNTVGALNVDGVSDAGLDISPRTNTAYAALTIGSVANVLYTVDLASGAATRVGTFGNADLDNNPNTPAIPATVEDIAVATTVFTATGSDITEGSSQSVMVTRRGDVADAATVSYALQDGTAIVGSDVQQATGTLSFGAGESSRFFTISTNQDDFTEGRENFRLVLSGATVGAAGAPVPFGIVDDEAGQAYGLTSDNFLTTFSVNTPGTQTSARPITGQVNNEKIVGIDVRPSTGVLYGVGNNPGGVGQPASSSLYTIDPRTVVATRVGEISVLLQGDSFGVDFNPVVDRLRVVSNTRQNLRIIPTTGVATSDTPLAYPATDNGTAPAVTAAGYINSSSAVPTATTLYDIDTSRNTLVTQNPANDGALVPVGSLGIGDVDLTSGLDISAAGNTAFALMSTTGTAASGAAAAVPAIPRSLFRVNLNTGAATSLGAFGSPGTAIGAVEDIALVSIAPATTPPPNANPSGINDPGASPSPSPSPSASPSASPSPSMSPSISPSPSPSATSTVNTAGRYTPVQPARIFDTRNGNTRVQAGADREVQVTGVGGIPSTGVSAVVLNVTVTNASARGDLQVYPTGQRPQNRTSNLNYFAGETVPVQIQTGVSSNGRVNLSVNTGNAQVIVDVFGYYSDSSGRAQGSSGYTALQPQRLLDTRTDGSPVVAGSDRTVRVAGLLGVPANATGVVLNTTVLGTPANADLQIYPTGSQPPNRTSNINVRRGQTKANSVTSLLGANGSVNLSVSQNGAQVVLDVLGYYSSDSRGRFIALTPARVFDTREDRAPIVAGNDRVVQISGRGGVPAGVSAAVLSVTGTGASNPVDLQVFPTGNRPTNRTSTVNFRPGEAVANVAIATLGSNGSVTLSLSQGSAASVLDVVGYITND